MQALGVNLALQLPPGPLDPESFLDSLRRFGLSQTFLGALDKVQDLLPSASHSEVVEILGNGIEAHRSVPAALFAFLSSAGDFERAIECAVRLGGDTDTIAAMTGALAGAAGGCESIPARWIERAEGGKSMLRMGTALLEEAIE